MFHADDANLTSVQAANRSTMAAYVPVSDEPINAYQCLLIGEKRRTGIEFETNALTHY